jgi:hypothetical protein
MSPDKMATGSRHIGLYDHFRWEYAQMLRQLMPVRVRARFLGLDNAEVHHLSDGRVVLAELCQRPLRNR